MVRKASKQRTRPRLVRWLGEKLRRLRHFRGHGVHSPYIYSIVRNVFMSRDLQEAGDGGLLEELMTQPIDRRLRVELHNLYVHCGYASYAINPEQGSARHYLIFMSDAPRSQVERVVAESRESGSTVVILRGKRNLERDLMLDSIVREHHSTTVDRGAYLLILNNHLPKQHFIL